MPHPNHIANRKSEFHYGQLSLRLRSAPAQTNFFGKPLDKNAVIG